LCGLSVRIDRKPRDLSKSCATYNRACFNKNNDQAKQTTQQDFNNETPFSPHLSQIRIRGRTPGGADDGVGVRAGGAEVVPAIVTSDLLKNSHSHIPNHAQTCCGPARVHGSTCGGEGVRVGQIRPHLKKPNFDQHRI